MSESVNEAPAEPTPAQRVRDYLRGIADNAAKAAASEDPELWWAVLFNTASTVASYEMAADELRPVAMRQAPSPADRYGDEVLVLVEGFRYELCAECGEDLNAHVIGPDPLGHAHAYCGHVDP